MYKIINSFFNKKIIHRLNDNTYIPFDLDNIDYVNYLEWLAAGNEPEIIEGNE